MAEFGCYASMHLRLNLRFNRRRIKECSIVYQKERGQMKKPCDITHIFSRTMPFAWEKPAIGFFHSLPRWLFLYALPAHLCLLLWVFSLRPAPMPRVFPILPQRSAPPVIYLGDRFPRTACREARDIYTPNEGMKLGQKPPARNQGIPFQGLEIFFLSTQCAVFLASVSASVTIR